MTQQIKNTHSARSLDQGGAVIIVIILVACLLVGLAAGFAARALTGERRPTKGTITRGQGEQGLAPEAGCAVLAAQAAVGPQAHESSISPYPVGFRAPRELDRRL